MYVIINESLNITGRSWNLKTDKKTFLPSNTRNALLLQLSGAIYVFQHLTNDWKLMFPQLSFNAVSTKGKMVPHWSIFSGQNPAVLKITIFPLKAMKCIYFPLQLAVTYPDCWLRPFICYFLLPVSHVTWLGRQTDSCCCTSRAGQDQKLHENTCLSV